MPFIFISSSQLEEGDKPGFLINYWSSISLSDDSSLLRKGPPRSSLRPRRAPRVAVLASAVDFRGLVLRCFSMLLLCCNHRVLLVDIAAVLATLHSSFSFWSMCCRRRFMCWSKNSFLPPPPPRLSVLVVAAAPSPPPPPSPPFSFGSAAGIDGLVLEDSARGTLRPCLRVFQVP